jgi:hypothetical protein
MDIFGWNGALEKSGILPTGSIREFMRDAIQSRDSSVPSGSHHYYYHPHLSAMQAYQPVAPDAHIPEATGFFY